MLYGLYCKSRIDRKVFFSQEMISLNYENNFHWCMLYGLILVASIRSLIYLIPKFKILEKHSPIMRWSSIGLFSSFSDETFFSNFLRTMKQNSHSKLFIVLINHSWSLLPPDQLYLTSQISDTAFRVDQFRNKENVVDQFLSWCKHSHPRLRYIVSGNFITPYGQYGVIGNQKLCWDIQL